MKIADIKLYERLRHSLGEEEAQELVRFIHSQIENEFMDCKDVFLTKEDKVELVQMIAEVEVRLNKSINDTERRLSKSFTGMTLLQLLSIIISVLALVTFMTK